MYILPLSSPLATLENAGGKGTSLSRLSRLGLNVPPGFILTTEAYRLFAEANGLGSTIEAAMQAITVPKMEAWEQASTHIRSAFSAGKIPEEIARQVLKAYQAIRPLTIDDGPSSMVSGPSSMVSGPSSISVAVRSSATAEDLSELSFAGQQDTFLNVIGEAQLLKAIVDCWSSLWTGRAIGYRERNSMGLKEIALAVIVQQMVPSETSGVLFTANPVTGLRIRLDGTNGAIAILADDRPWTMDGNR